MGTLFDLVFEVNEEIEELACKLYKSFNRYSFTHKRWPVSYEIVFDNYTKIDDLKNKYKWGILVTREDGAKTFLYYRTDKHFLPGGICLNYFDI